MDNIRNFSIIAHVDHGKSTLSDRIIQICGGLSEREMEEQVLDSMPIERERGITIKAQSVTLNYKAKNDKIYQFNFIDTPGHVDFSYEVSRALAASEGVLLIIDVSQGVEAQTLANCYTAIEMNLEVILVLNKIDLPNIHPEQTIKEIEDIIGIDASTAIPCSAKTGMGVRTILEKIVNHIPSPQGDPLSPLQALIIDSWFNNYLGIISLVRIKNGTLYQGDKIKIMSTNKIYNVDCLGVFTPKKNERIKLKCGEIGWVTCGIKDIRGAPVGDTITGAYNSADMILPGFKKIQPLVYASLFPTSSNEYEIFRDALEKLSLNDASLFYETENSSILGSGFRCGFLGMLHIEIIQERLEREYNLNLITTLPTVVYEIKMKDKKIIYIDNPSMIPPTNIISEIREPIVECRILTPQKYLGRVISLCVEKRGIQTEIIYHGKRVTLIYNIPMAEIILNFFDQLKSLSRGYASLEYNFKYFKIADIVRVDILINGNRIDALSHIIHRSNAFYQGRKLVEKMKDLIPRHQFDIVVQAAIGRNIIARSIVKQLRKNVLAKCYGGDVSRKKKLLQKQKEGKKRMKQIGNINLPQEAFLAILHINRNS